MLHRYIQLAAVVAFAIVATALMRPEAQVSAAGVIRVAVEQGGSSTGSAVQLAAQLNDDTFFDFTATVVSADQIDSLDELANYDVVIFGDSGSGNPDWTLAMATALRDWAQSGGGVISTGWADYAIGQGGNDARDAMLDEVMPIDAYPDTVNLFCGSQTTINLAGIDHPVTAGLVDFLLPTSGDVEISPVAPDGVNSQVLATASGSCTSSTTNAVVVGDLGKGRLVYLGPVYLGSVIGYNNGDLRSGPANQLLEQAVAWASGQKEPTILRRPRVNLGGLFAASPNPNNNNNAPAAGGAGAQPAAAAPSTAVLRPPSTGDGGLASHNTPGSNAEWLAFVVVAGLLAAAWLKATRTSN